MLIQCFLFYLSRFRNKTKLSLAFSILIIHVILVANFFYNSGIEGPSFLLLLAVFVIVTAISTPKSYKYWLSLNVLVALTLISLQYFSPQTIQNLEASRLTTFSDIATTYCLCALMILIGLYYLKMSYYNSQALLKAKASDLEAINQSKNKMFSIVSHDLRAPIASIQTYLEILSKTEMDNEDRQKIKTDLLQLTQSTDMMLSNLLMWSRTQMEGIVMDRKLLRFGEIITPIAEVLESIATRKGVKIDYSFDPNLQLLADKDMLQLVIRNLLNNAIKFSYAGATVVLKAKHEGSLCKITISDTGVGMNEDTAKLIFAGTARSTYGTENEKGIGLGLSLCKEFTELQEGTLQFESQVGKGTTFHIKLPTTKT